jgi:hypothetical protein
MAGKDGINSGFGIAPVPTGQAASFAKRLRLILDCGDRLPGER